MAMEWDAQSNVWKGNKASAVCAIPDPLYIFGYGSLLWRPGDLLSKYQSYPCSCIGWTRLFAQRSMDHRGTSRFPGFVATLVSDSYLKDIGMLSPSSPASTCIGSAFLVPKEEAEELIAELDFREKGGYHRHILPVKFLARSPYHEVGEVGQALVYTGSTDNPNFHLRVSDPRWQHRVAEVMSAAIGPSGPNAQYLLNLYSFVRQQGIEDPHLSYLSLCVCRAISAWRGKLLLLEEHLDAEATDMEIVSCDPAGEGGGCLVGWGSNETAQLVQTRHDQHHMNPTGRDDLLYRAEVIRAQVPGGRGGMCPLLRAMRRQVYAGGSRSGLQIGSTLYMWGDLRSHGCSVLDKDNSLRMEEDAPCWIWTWSSDGRGVCRISRGLLHVFATVVNGKEGEEGGELGGWGGPGAGVRNVLEIRDVVCASFGHAHTLVLLTNGLVLAFGSDDHGQCSGGAELGALHLDGTTATCRDIYDDVPPPPPPTPSFSPGGTAEGPTDSPPVPPFGVVKLSAGLHHSAAVTSSGVLLTWGCMGSASPLSRILEAPWLPPPALPGPSDDEGSEAFTGGESGMLVDEHCGVVPLVVDVCCGAKHTVALDSVGRIFTFGDNTHGQLGRHLQDVHDHSGQGRRGHTCRVPTSVLWRGGYSPGRYVRWKEVSCGWSYTVARGVTLEGDIVHVAWGRNDMGQVSSDISAKKVPYPILLEPPPGKALSTVWCGSEFMLVRAVDPHEPGEGRGELWGRGWSEHGNLGQGTELLEEPVERCHWKWQPTLQVGGGIGGLEVDDWGGLVACGGAHCIALIGQSSGNEPS